MTKKGQRKIAERLATFMGMELTESRTEFKLLPGREPRQIPKWLIGRFSWEELDLRLSAMGF